MIGIGAMRAVYFWLGIPLCRLLTVVRWIFKPFVRAQKREPRHVLIIKMSEMGSTVLAIPALLEIRRRYPSCRLSMLVFSNNRAIVDWPGFPLRVDIVPLDVTSPSRLPDLYRERALIPGK